MHRMEINNWWKKCYKVKFLAYFAYIVFSNSTKRYDFGSKSCSHPDKLWLFWPHQLVFFTLKVKQPSISKLLKLYILKKHLIYVEMKYTQSIHSKKSNHVCTCQCIWLYKPHRSLEGEKATFCMMRSFSISP